MSHTRYFRHISNGQIIRSWSAASADHDAEPETAPAPRVLHWRVQLGTWADQPRSKHDNHKRRDRQRRQQQQARETERTISIFM